MVHSVSGCMRGVQVKLGCAGKTVRSLENACYTLAPYRCDHDKAIYKSTFTFIFTLQSNYQMSDKHSNNLHSTSSNNL